jgi:glutamyl-tRNA reductase
MPTDAPNAETPGAVIAAQMLENLILLNRNIEKSHQIYETLSASIADLCDYHETYMRAMEILIEQAEEGKSKFTLGDLAKATAEAAAEVMPDEDGEEEDEPGDEDPRVRAVR